jgi:hypothetical protein
MYRFFSDNYIVDAIAVVTSVCTLNRLRFFKFYLEPLASFWQTSALSKSGFSDPVELLKHLLQQLGLRVQQLERMLDSLDKLKTALLIGYKTLGD